MTWVRASAVRWVSDEPYPGWVEVQIDLTDDTVAKLFDKPPVFVPDDSLRPDAEYPVSLALECQIAADGVTTDTASATLCVTLAHGVNDLSGTAQFCVRVENVTIHE